MSTISFPSTIEDGFNETAWRMDIHVLRENSPICYRSYVYQRIDGKTVLHFIGAMNFRNTFVIPRHVRQKSILRTILTATNIVDLAANNNNTVDLRVSLVSPRDNKEYHSKVITFDSREFDDSFDELAEQFSIMISTYNAVQHDEGCISADADNTAIAMYV